MPTKIESSGTYIGTIAESAVGLTKAGKPQWVARLAATKKYVESKEEIAHFQAQGLLADGLPGYVDWTAFDEDMICYLMLYNSTEEISPQTEMKNAEQLHVATGWVRPDFNSLAGPPVLGAEILFRVGEKKAHTTPEGKTYGGDGTLEVSWIDHKDAAPERTLKSLDQTGIAGLMAKVSGYSQVSSSPKPVAPAKPVLTKPSTVKPAVSAAAPAAPTAPVASAPSAPSGVSPAAAAAPSTPAAASAGTGAAAPKAPKKAKTPPTPKAPPVAAPPQPAADANALPAEITMEQAWEFVCTNKGEKEDSVVEDSWLGAVTEVSAGREAEALTTADWAKIRDTVLAKLAA